MRYRNNKNNGPDRNTKNNGTDHGKPFQHYFGGKNGSGTYQKIINIIPPHKVFISGFLGNCGIMLNKKPAEINIGLDVDPEVIYRWNKKALPNITVQKFNALKYLQKFAHCNAEQVVIYLDPPYPHCTVANSTVKYGYKYTMTDRQHVRLLNLINQLPFNILISTYDNVLYSSMLTGWNKLQFESASWGEMKTETVYFNYDRPTELHDYRYLGEDYRERERIKNLTNRRVNGILRLPPLERNKLLHEIQERIINSDAGRS